MRPVALTQLAVGVFAAVIVLFGPTRASAQSDVPFVGRITHDDASVHAGAGNAYYVVGNVEKGTLVTVEDLVFSVWYKVIPPKGVYSYIPSDVVDVRADGKVGTITSDRVAVKAAALTGPGDSYKAQRRLFKGDTVQIVGKDGDAYYKIIPPKDTYVFIRTQSIERAPMTAKAADPQPKPDPTPEPASSGTGNSGTVTIPPAVGSSDTADEAVDEAVDSAVDVAGTETGAGGSSSTSDDGMEAEADAAEGVDTAMDTGDDTAVVGIDDSAILTGPTETTDAADLTAVSIVRSDALQTAELRYTSQMALPLEQRDTKGLLQAYQTLATDLSLSRAERSLVKARLRRLERDKILSDAMAEIAAARQEIKTHQSQRVAAAEAARAATPKQQYDVVGKLLASGVYDGRNLPRLYRLVAVSDLSTIAYIRPSRELEAATFGQVVGIVGTTTFDPALKVQVVDIESLDVLGAQ